MQLLQAFFPITVLLCIIESREYHYDKPALPFLENAATNEVQSPANTVNYRQGVPTQGGGISLPTVIQTSGSSATNYELYDMQSSQQIFQGTAVPQPATVTYQRPSPHVNYNSQPWLQQMNSNAYAFPTHTQAYASRAPIAQNYRQQGSLQVPQQIVQPGAQAGQSTIVNPFTSYNPNAPVSNIDQRITQYRAPPPQLIAAPQPSFNTQYGAPTRGDYVSQSESGQLDVYSYKHQGGDARVYKRIITTCYPNGHCERLQLNAGPTDSNQNNVISSTRSYTAPVPNKCQRIAEAKRQAALSQAAQGSLNVPVVQSNVPYVVGPIRPANRRLFPYSEIVLPRDPYN